MSKLLSTQARTTLPAFVRSSLRSLHLSPGRADVELQPQAAADGKFFETPDGSRGPADRNDARDGGSPLDAVSPTDSDSKEGEPEKPQKVPDSQWYPGIIGYAVTNVGFIKMFEFAVDVTDIRLTLAVMAVYYAAAYLLRFILRRIFKVDRKFPQFFWEGFPQRYNN